jgi:predicted peptidase
MIRPMKTLLTRRVVVAAASLSISAGLAACGGSSTTASSTPTPTTPTQAASQQTGGGPPAGGGQTASPSTAASQLASEVKSKFKQATYKDATTGNTLPYNVYLPDGYDPSKTYPVVFYIADSSLVGQDVTAPLSQFGALVWASKAQQAKQQAIVIVPEYPSIIIDDQGSAHTKTPYVELTARFVAAMEKTYSVDTSRVYGTGQSMGAMTVMTLAAEHPDLFTAEMIVSGQWDPAQLTGLAKAKFVYTAAGGDEKASGGQTDVEAILKSAGVAYRSTTLDATASAASTESAAKQLLSAGDEANFVTFKTGTVLTASGQTSAAQQMGGEHMASFEPAYKIAALRDWLMAQTA